MNSTHFSARRRVILGWLAIAIMFAVLTVFDELLWEWLRFDPEKKLELRDWWQVLRQFGSLLVWAIIGGSIALLDARPKPVEGAGRWRGLMVFLGAAVGGGLAELMKIVVQRARPMGDGRYHFGWTDDKVHAFGLASSHAGVAFGGAIMLGWLFPPLRIPALLLASGTAMTRLAVGVHYTTDVFAALILSYAGCRLVWRFLGPRPDAAPLDGAC